MAVGKGGVLLLQVTTVGQDNGAQVARTGRRMDLAGKSLFDQQGQVAVVVQMGMGQQDRPHCIRQHWQRRPVAQAQLLVAQKLAAVDQQALGAMLYQVL